MPIVTTLDDELAESIATLVADLGSIELHRIRRFPTPGTATEDDLAALAQSPGKPFCELVHGTLVEKVMGFQESLLALSLAGYLREFVLPRNLGLVSGADGMMRLFPGRVRIPDVAFIAWDRLPDRRLPTAPIPELSPSLAVEILSVSNTHQEMEVKRRDYFRSGTVQVWEVDPVTRTVAVFTAIDRPTLYRIDDTLSGGELLPGFTLSLTQLFAELDRHG